MLRNDLVHEAQGVLKQTSARDYKNVRNDYIAEARNRFGDDVAKEVADALPSEPPPGS